MLNRIKRIRSHTGHARFLAECEDDGFWMKRQQDIPSPYHSSEEWRVYEWRGKLITVVETSHRCFDVFEVPEMAIRSDDPIETEQESNYLRSQGI